MLGDPLGDSEASGPGADDRHFPSCHGNWFRLRRSFVALVHTDRGYDPAGVLTALLSFPGSLYTPERRYARWIGHLSPDERQDLYTTSFQERVEGSDPEQLFVEAFGRSDADDWTDATLDTDVGLYLADDLLVKMDRATMASSLEARSPLLDHVLMEYVASLPPTFKLSGGQKKRIFKAALRGDVPDAILDRPKMGFGAPISSWFRNELREMAQDLLLSPRAVQRAYFRPAVVGRLLDEHISGQADHGEDLWDLLVLEVWHQTFIDRGPRVSVPHGPVPSAV